MSDSCMIESLMPINDSDPQRPKGRGRPPSDEKSRHTARIAVALLPEDKRELARLALEERHRRGLSERWGISDYVREVLQAHLESERLKR